MNKKFNVKDHYFKKAKKDNFLARSVYKLEEIDQKYKLINQGSKVVDFGYHPGSWTQYCLQAVGRTGSVVGIDIRPINKKLMAEKNLTLHEKSIFDISCLKDLNQDEAFDLVVSDMAPNTSGIKSLDQDRSLALVEQVFEVLPLYLKAGGNFVIKVFDSQQAQQYLMQNKNLFKEFYRLKPKSTRAISKEFFAIGKGFKA